MEKKNIALGGMSFIPTDGVSDDGDMQLLVNMRHSGGEIVQRQKPKETTFTDSETGADMLFGAVKFHASSGIMLAVTSNGRMLWDCTNNKSVAFGAGTAGLSIITDFAIMGNVVVLYRVLNDKPARPAFVIWRGEDYEYLGEIPDAPELNFSYAASRKRVISSSEYYILLTKARENNAEDLYYKYVRKGFVDQVLNQWYQEGGYIDRALFRVALRLFDGSYISYSPTYYTECLGAIDTATGTAQGGAGNFYTDTVYDGVVFMKKISASVVGYTLGMSLKEFDLSKWENIIVGVDVFTTGSIPMHKAEKCTDTRDDTDGNALLITREYEDYALMEDAEIVSSLTTADMFYKVAEFDLTGRLVHLEENTSPSNLVTKDILPDYSTAHEIGAALSTLYNSRLHMGNADKVLFKGYCDFRAWYNGMGADKDIKKITSVVYLDTEDGEKIVMHNNVNTYSIGPNISPFLIYPDSRAKKMELYILYDNGGTASAGAESYPLYSLAYRSFDLTKHRSLNMAYHINISETLGVVVETYCQNGTISWSNSTAELAYVRQFFGYKEGTYTVTYTENGFYYGDTPFTLRISYRGALTLGDTITFTLTEDEAVANGYSLLNYTDKDFWTICSVSDDTAPDNVTLLWKEVATGITVLDNFIVDIETDAVEPQRGVLRVSAVDNPFYFPTAQTYKFDAGIVGVASNAEAVSQGQFGQYPLFVFTKEGIWALQVDTSGAGAYLTQTPFSREVCNGAIAPVSGGVVFATDRGVMMISGGGITELSAALDGAPPLFDYSQDLFTQLWDLCGLKAMEIGRFRDYLKGAVLAYNYLYNEIILSNRGKGFSYVYGLNSRRWAVIPTVFNHVTNSYPELVVFDNDEKSTMIEFETGEGDNEFLVVTRPVKFQDLGHKRIRQSALRGEFSGSVFFYVLGSNDGATWRVVTGKEQSADLWRDLVTPMSRSAVYRFISFAIVGKGKGRFALIENLTDDAFTGNKLR